MSNPATMEHFFAARLDEDEQVARQASEEAEEPAGRETRYPYPGRLARSMHDARHNPARVLRDIEADRRLLTAYAGSVGGGPDFDGGYSQGLEDAIRIRLTAWSDHPDYRQEWKP